MLRYLKWKYVEWKYGNETIRMEIAIRNHPRAKIHTANFNRYYAIAYVVGIAYKYNLVVFDGRGISVDDNGLYVVIPIYRKHFNKLLSLTTGVK